MAGEPAVAVFPPSAVAVFAEEPKGSPRNVFRVRLAAIEPRGDVVRLRAAAAARRAGVGRRAGRRRHARPRWPTWPSSRARELWFAVKATETSIYPSRLRDG